ncbi:NLR family CARD domain-containing protein 4-like isoform X2 [Patiria miniata]|uniref:NACHT domain-containing protein n=1 Tax=Patiria miniata TaxID=46514 RepID=A0A913ZFX1_PATMI|nr:NLR family CARD domain-containing protein 4-like isoform X2 [Patiria miniata]
MAEQEEMMPTQDAERQGQVADGDCAETQDQALALRGPGNQDQTTDMIPVAAVDQLQQSVQQISKDDAHASHHSGHPSVDISENPPSTSQQPPTRHVASGAQGCSAPKKMKLDSPAQDAADCCQKDLKWYYRMTGSFVDLIPWFGDDRKHILDIYTKLQLILGKDKVMLTSYDDILLLKTKEGELIPIAVLTGLAGRGKTTLFNKIAYDWAVGSSQVLQKYKLVFLLKMHALEQSSDLVDAVFDQLLAKDVSIERGALDMFIKNSPGKVLVLLDGFDELMTTTLCESSFGSILEILSGKVLRGCTVLVSTRPSHFDRLVSKELVQDPFAHVRVLGFSSKDVTEYVNKFFTGEPDKAKGLLEKIESSHLLSTLGKSPMLLLLMCVLWREDCTLQETMSRLYSDGVSYIFKRKGLDSQHEVSKVMIEIGKVALHGLLSPDQSLSFKESDFKFEPSVLDLALKAGILTRQRVRKRLQSHNSVQFIHKTFQEFSAAAYLQSLLEADPEEFQKILNEIMTKGARRFEYLLRFCCGDNEACTYEILKVFQVRCQEELSFKSKMGQLALHCYFEGQSKRLPPEELIQSFIADQITIKHLDRDCLNSVTYFLKCVADQTRDSGNAYLAKVQKFCSFTCNLRWCVEDFAFAMCAMKNLYAVLLTSCSLTGSNMADIAKSLRDLSNLGKLEVFLNNLGGTAALWCMHLKEFKTLTKLALSYCSLTEQDIKNIAESLMDLPNLGELGFAHNKLGGTAALWCMHLKQLKSLTKLDLGGCSLNGPDIKHVAESLRDLPNLVELDLSRNHDLGGTAALWCMEVKQLKSLTKLGLGSCSLNGQDIKHVAESLGDLPNLGELNLNGNNLGGTAALWCMHLKQLKSLTKLNLISCSLNGQDIKHVAESLRDLPNLGQLNLSDNYDLDGTAALWCTEVKQLLHLQRLDLNRCPLTEEDKNHINESLTDLKKNGLVIAMKP